MSGRHSYLHQSVQPVRWRGLWRSARGIAVVEFILVAQLFFLLLFGLVDVALLLNTRLVMIHAAREGLRRAAIEGGATAAVYAQIQEQLALGALEADTAQIAITPKQASYGTRITVSIAYSFRPLTPVARLLFGKEIPLRIELTGRSERLR